MLDDLLGKFQLSDDEVTIVEHIIRQFVPATAAILKDYFHAVSVALTMEKDLQTGKKSPLKMVLKQVTQWYSSIMWNLWGWRGGVFSID